MLFHADMPRVLKLDRLALLVGVAAIAGAAASGACSRKPVEAPEAAPRTLAEETVIDDFKTRLDRYNGISTGLRDEVFPSTSEAESAEIHRRQKELARRIASALPDWQQGAIFTPGISDLIRRRLAEVLAGPQGANIRGAIFDEAPPPQRVVVMSEYPAGLPVATVPAQILERLPVLPKQLEYRFIGKDLILFDVSAYLMVDVIRGAIE